MDNHDQQIDQVFQNRLRDASVPPPAFVWTGVERELRKRRRKMLVWWWTGSGALLVVATLLYFNNNTSRHTASNVPAVDGLEIPPASKITSPTGSQEFAAPGDRQSEIKPVEHEISANNSGIALTRTVKTPKAADQTVYKNPALQPAISSTVLPASEEPAVAPPDATMLQEVTTPDIQKKNKVVEILAAEPSLLTRKVVKPSSKNWPVKITKKKKEKSDNCYDFASHRNALLLEGYIGPVSAGKGLTTISPENNQYLIKRQQTEGHGWGINGGIRATYLFREHFSISAGLQYDQFTEVFSFNDPAYILVLTRAGVNPITGAPTLDTLDVSFVKETTKIYNRYGFLDVPISIGYEIRQGRGGIRLQGGTSINLLFRKRGAIINPVTDKPARFTPDKGSIDVFNSNAGLSLQGSMQFFWSMEPRTRLFAEPYYRKILDPITLESHPLTQRLDIWGVRLGMTKIF